MDRDLLDRLDAIERSNPEPWVDSEALDLLRAAAQTPDDLRLLMARYGGSSSANVVGYLALLLAERAATPTQETAPLVFELIARLSSWDEPGTIQCCLKAIWLQVLYEVIWEPVTAPPALLYPFVQHCLDYAGAPRDAVAVWAWAIKLLSALDEKGLLATVFAPQQRHALRERLADLATLDEELLQPELAWLADFIGDG